MRFFALFLLLISLGAPVHAGPPYPDHYNGPESSADIGTPDPDKGKDAYAILGVSPNASKLTIDKAFKAAARMYHPDLNQGMSDRAIKKINNAHDLLTDNEKRFRYDALNDIVEKASDRTAEAKKPGGATPSHSRPSGLQIDDGPYMALYRQFEAERRAVYSDELGMPMLGVLAIRIKDKGPVEGFLSYMKEFYPPSTDWQNNERSAKWAEFVEKWFLPLFEMNNPRAVDWANWFGIMNRYYGYNAAREVVLQHILDASETPKEATNMLVWTKMFHKGSGWDTEKVIANVAQKFGVNPADAAYDVAMSTVREKLEASKSYIKEDIYKSVISNLRGQKTTQALYTLMRINHDVPLTEELAKNVKRAVHEIATANPLAVEDLKARDPSLESPAKAMVALVNEENCAWERTQAWMKEVLGSRD